MSTKTTSNQAGILPSILDIIRDFMLQEGFEPSRIKIWKNITISYDNWQLAGISPRGQFYMIPFKTNEYTFVNPADPEFFTIVKDCLVFPAPNELFGVYWDESFGHRRVENGNLPPYTPN